MTQDRARVTPAMRRASWLGASPLPQFSVNLSVPDLRPWLAGNAGIPGVWRFATATPGPHVVITALIHGNEFAGAIALDHWLRQGPRPSCGTLSLVFANLAAAASFDAANPTMARFIDEDMNRLWDPVVLDSSRASSELNRARALRPVIDSADVLLDLHSMLWPGDPLILCGPTRKGRRLAAGVAVPTLVVADHGHMGGKRLIDYGPFVDEANPRTAILVEAGPHWESETVQTMLSCIDGVLDVTGLGLRRPLGAPPRLAEVTTTITARTGAFMFNAAYRGGEVIRHRGTSIAVDGECEIRTPYDDCMLVMPSLRPGRGHTAVRLARFVKP